MRARILLAAAVWMVFWNPGGVGARGVPHPRMHTMERQLIALLTHASKARTVAPGSWRLVPVRPGALHSRAAVHASIPQSAKAARLELPDSAFSPATIDRSHTFALDGGAADEFGFRVNHWWGYARLGMISGFLKEAAAVTTDTGEGLGFGWLAGIYPSPGAAAKAMTDGMSRTGQWGSSVDCKSSVAVPCRIFTYLTTDGGEASYIVFQVNECMAETKAVAVSAAAYASHMTAINLVHAIVTVAGVKLLQAVCTGAVTPAPRAAGKPAQAAKSQKPAAAPTLIVTDCVNFRNTMWGFAQRISDLQQQWWTVLQDDYSSNYPPPADGSGITQTETDAAKWDMNDIHLQLNDTTTHTGLLFHLHLVGIVFGVKDISQSGPYPWATNRVFGAGFFLDKAAQAEWAASGSGMDSYHTAQQMLSNAWDALKQLPCG